MYKQLASGPFCFLKPLCEKLLKALYPGEGFGKFCACVTEEEKITQPALSALQWQ